MKELRGIVLPLMCVDVVCDLVFVSQCSMWDSKAGSTGTKNGYTTCNVQSNCAHVRTTWVRFYKDSPNLGFVNALDKVPS